MELVELIRGAQDAMDNGDYRLAVAECRHILETYPSCLTAHRTLGEASLEQGQIDTAIEHFERTLALDPLNVVARLGLGVASEERKEMSRAYAEYLYAWETNPALDQVRDELVRLRGLLGGGERLHPTRAGLAGIFARSGQFGRAAAEWRAVLLVEPDSQRAKTSLAEVLWRAGDDPAAAATAREVLGASPENARALAILADIDHRRNGAGVNELIERYQEVDPAGEVVTLLAEWREELDLSFLRRSTAPVPEFAFVAAPVGVPAYAAVTPSTNALKSTNSLAGGHFGAPDLWDNLIRDFQPGAPENGAADDVLPFSWMEEGETATLATPAEPFSLDALLDPRAANPLVAEEPFADLAPAKAATNGLSVESQLSAMMNEPTAAPVVPARMPETPAPAPRPVVPAAAAVNPAPSPFVTADGQVDLTVGWDDLDRQLREATPTFDNASEMDALAAQLGVDGVMPFDMGESGFESDAWAPFTAEDLAADAPMAAASVAAAPVVPEPAPDPVVAAAPEPVVAMAADELALDLPEVAAFDLREFDPSATSADEPEWELDEELLSAIPAPQSSGYTDLLRHIDIETPPQLDFGDEINPFASPDSVGTPLAFEDLLAVTSKDGTAPLGGGGSVVDEAPAVAADDDLFAAALAAESPAGAAAAADLAGFDFGDEPLPAELVGGDPFDALMAGLGEVQPFTLDDTLTEEHPAESIGTVDFSDINEPPFDPASLAGVIAPPAPPPVPEAPAVPAWHALLDEEPAALEPAVAGAPAALPELEPRVAVEEPLAARPVVPKPPKKGTNGLGLPPSGVVWPTFVNQSSELMDRGFDNGSLFERLREAKRAAIVAGALKVDRVLAARPVAATSVRIEEASERLLDEARVPDNGEVKRVQRVTKMTEAERIDLMAMRIRLIEDDSAAGEVVKHLESAVARGLHDPLALRVLGEAYLKLGRTEQAAAQFRQAMLARHRAR